MLEEQEIYIKESKINFAAEKIRNRFCCNILNICYLPTRYDVIWIQWVVGHLSDLEFVDLLKTAKNFAGTIILKDNYSRTSFMYDEIYGNIIRNLSIYNDIFREAGVKVL